MNRGTFLRAATPALAALTLLFARSARADPPAADRAPLAPAATPMLPEPPELPRRSRALMATGIVATSLGGAALSAGATLWFSSVFAGDCILGCNAAGRSKNTAAGVLTAVGMPMAIVGISLIAIGAKRPGATDESRESALEARATVRLGAGTASLRMAF